MHIPTENSHFSAFIFYCYFICILCIIWHSSAVRSSRASPQCVWNVVQHSFIFWQRACSSYGYFLWNFLKVPFCSLWCVKWCVSRLVQSPLWLKYHLRVGVIVPWSHWWLFNCSRLITCFCFLLDLFFQLILKVYSHCTVFAFILKWE